jgi:glyoxylase-like metal-dependent hydrolase (beta-lactamase superfamily II)
VAVIDPGPDLPAHGEAILAALAQEGERVATILVTHTHRDHSPAARLLRARTGAPVIGCTPPAPFRPLAPGEVEPFAAANDGDHAPDRVLADGEAVTGAGYTLRALATPGHTANHLSFHLPEERCLFSGDHVMAWATTIVAPPGGAMAPYMASLELLKGRDDEVYWPGHGGPVREPQRFVRALIHHRRQREHAIMSRLAAGDETIAAIVATTYDALDPRLVRAAGLSVQAHLEDLCARGLVRLSGEAGSGRYAPA